MKLFGGWYHMWLSQLRCFHFRTHLNQMFQTCPVSWCQARSWSWRFWHHYGGPIFKTPPRGGIRVGSPKSSGHAGHGPVSTFTLRMKILILRFHHKNGGRILQNLEWFNIGFDTAYGIRLHPCCHSFCHRSHHLSNRSRRAVYTRSATLTMLGTRWNDNARKM